MVWSSELNAKHKSSAMKSWATPVFRYNFGILKWSRACLNSLDARTRRITRKHQRHQYGAAVEWLYLPRRVGGRGLQNVLNVWEQEAVSTACYLVSVTSDVPNIQGVVREQGGYKYGTLLPNLLSLS